MKRLALLMLAAFACGGSKPQVNEPTPGESQATPPPTPVGPDTSGEPGQPPATAPVPPETQPAQPPAPPSAPAAVTFELKNEGKSDLNFGVTKGWGPVIFAYTGKPPKAKSVILFESACTASCDTPVDAVCPDCPEPANKKEEQAMQRIETAAPGATLTVPWDGKVLVYEKAPGKKRCKCFRRVDPEAGSYTVKACGLRASTEAGKPSRPVCAETAMTVGAGAPATVTLSFPK